MLQYLHDVWEIDNNFEGNLWEDYTALKSEDTDLKTSWCDNYTTVIYRMDEQWTGPNIERFQTIHDGWKMGSCIISHMNRELMLIRDSIQSCFYLTCSHILDLAYLVVPEPSPTIIRCLGVLSWTTEEEVLKYYE